MLLEAEQALVARLQYVLLPDFDLSILPFPEDLSKLPSPGRKGQILVGYKRSLLQMKSSEPMICAVNAEFELSLQLRDLRSHKGAYPILDATRYALTGLIVLCGPAGKCYPSQESFVKLEESTWYYSQTFIVPMQQIEGVKLYHAFDDPEAAFNPSSPNYSGNIPSGISNNDGGVNGDGTTDTPPTPVQVKSGVWRSALGWLPAGASQIDDDFEHKILDQEFPES